jgi:hypothetical protein
VERYRTAKGSEHRPRRRAVVRRGPVVALLELGVNLGCGASNIL